MEKELLYHKSVLVQEVLEHLNIMPGKVYLDVTFGSGGHTRAILESDATVRVVAIDWDAKSLDTYGALLKEEFGDRITLLWGNFAHLHRILKKAKIKSVDGILADFGTSQMQIADRAGFSVYRNTPLDMRMSQAHSRTTAIHVVNKASEQELSEIFWKYSDERFSKRIARAIVRERKNKRLKTTGDLVAIIEKIIVSKGKRIHPATRIFQALRIYVNNELENIHSFLKAAIHFLNPSGRLVCISFHSLEDILVKQFFKDEKANEVLQIITKKVVMPTSEEVSSNPSSRSAKLRAAEYVV